MKKILLTLAGLLLSCSGYGHQNEHTFNSFELNDFQLKALPSLCNKQIFDDHISPKFISVEYIQEPASSASSITEVDGLATTNNPYPPTKTSFSVKRSQKKKSLKGSVRDRVKEYLYSVVNENLNINLHQFTSVNVMDTMRFELEPKISFKGELESIKLTAILFE